MIKTLRDQIDKIDAEILHLLQKRMKKVSDIGEIKQELSEPIVDQARWEEILSTKLEKAKELGLNENMIQEIYEIIHKYSINAQ